MYNHQTSHTTELSRAALEEVLGFKVMDFSKYVPVFTHKSATKITGGDNYERLEFLGDSIIGCMVTVMLFTMYPTADEGFLTRLRTKLVSGKCLSQLAHNMGLHRFIIMNPRSMRCGFNTNPRILEDVFESLVGCIYTDLGMATTKTFLMRVYHRYVDFTELLKDTNYKDGLMRYAQIRGIPLPEYTVVKCQQTMQQHNASEMFLVEARVGAGTVSMVGQGCGGSKKQAEQEAAKHLLYLLGELAPGGDIRPAQSK
jgi:ribonuclease-3